MTKKSDSNNQVLLKGLKGKTWLAPGFVFTPYVPLQVSHIQLNTSPVSYFPFDHPPHDPRFPVGEYPEYRLTDCLVVGEMYRIETSPFAQVPLWSSVEARHRIGHVHNGQVVQFLKLGWNETGHKNSNNALEFFYKVFAEDQAGWVWSRAILLNYINPRKSVP